MKTVRPKPLGGGQAPPANLRLTAEEDFVLARIDGRLSVQDLVALTGIDEPRVEQIVSKLAQSGAVMLEGAEGPSSGYLPDVGSDPDLLAPRSAGRTRTDARLPAIPVDAGVTSFADFAAVLGMDPSAFAASSGGTAAVEQPVAEERVESRSNYPPPATSEPPEAMPSETRSDDFDEDLANGPQLEEVTDEEEAADAAASEEADAEEDEEAEQLKEQDYRKLYESQFHHLTPDARVARAKTAHGPDLLALCLDADPRVIASVLENASCGLRHARLIAFHHRTGVGLEILTRRMDFLRDMLVERRLLRNPQAGDTVLGRIMASKRLFQTYKIAIDRDVPELTRAKSRGYMRKKYQSAPPEERADLVLRTEGRCLIYMTGCAFDAKMTAILCGKQYNSVLFIQNFAKFSATPPALLAHLMKQAFVRKSAPLKKLLLQHPNMPGDVKRQM
jgi:hypothetical protein